MALPNGDLITTPFDPQMAYPSDRRMQVDTLNSRDSISMYIRWEGMTVYVLENSKIYILQGGRSNEYWKELGTGTGTGGTTFVGQFESADLLPTSGRSAGDYAFVGTGEDFVQYNWDNIANEWVIQAETNLSAFDFYQNGQKTIYVKGTKDIVITDGGDIIASPEFMGNLVFTNPFNLRGVVDALGDKEFTIENSSGEPGTIEANYVGGPANSAFNIPETITIQNGEKLTFKSEDGKWVVSQNSGEVAWSDRLDAVGAIRSVGPDGLEVITMVQDKETGRQISFKEYEGIPPITDGIIFVQIDSTYFINTDFLEQRKVNASQFGVNESNSPEDNQSRLQMACDVCAAIGSELVIGSGPIPILISGPLVLTDSHSGLVISKSGSGTSLMFPGGTGNIGSLIDIRNTVTGVPKDIRITGLTLDGNKQNRPGASSGSCILIYNPPGTAAIEEQNIVIDSVQVKNSSGNGITAYTSGIILNNIVAFNCNDHGVATNPPGGHVIIDNVISYENGGYGVDVSGGSAIVNNVWAFQNGLGGMKTSVDTEKFIGTNLYLYENTGVGFQTTGSAPDMEMTLNNITCRDNGQKGISITTGKNKRLDNIYLINNNTSGSADFDNGFVNVDMGYLYVSDHASAKKALYFEGKCIVENLIYKNNATGILAPSSTALYLQIKNGRVENTGERFANISGHRNHRLTFEGIEFVDTTVENTQAIALTFANTNRVVVRNCDFTQNPGTKITTAGTDIDLNVVGCQGFDSSIASSNTNYTFVPSDKHRYVKLTGASGAGTMVVTEDRFEAGDELNGEVQGGGKNIVVSGGVTLRYNGGTPRVNTNQRFKIKFTSANDALVTIFHDSVPDSSTTVKGIIELATQTEVNTGTDAVRAVTPLTLQAKFDDFATYNSFTPTITGSVSNPTFSYSEQFGRYAKIGRLCYFDVRITWESISGGSGNVRIALPFTKDQLINTGGVAVGERTGIDPLLQINGLFASSSVGFKEPDGSDIAISDLESLGTITVSGTFITAS